MFEEAEVALHKVKDWIVCRRAASKPPPGVVDHDESSVRAVVPDGPVCKDSVL